MKVLILLWIVQLHARSVTLTRWLGNGYCSGGYGVIECNCCKGSGCTTPYPPDYTWSNSCNDRSNWTQYCSQKVSNCLYNNNGNINGINNARCYSDGSPVSFLSGICLGYSGYYFQVDCYSNNSYLAKVGSSCDSLVLPFYGAGSQTCIPFTQTNPVMSIRVDCGHSGNTVAESLDVNLGGVKKKKSIWNYYGCHDFTDCHFVHDLWILSLLQRCRFNRLQIALASNSHIKTSLQYNKQ